MYTRFIEFYRFDLSGDGIHTLNYIVSGSLDLDPPAVLSLGRCPPDTASLPRSLPYFILV